MDRRLTGRLQVGTFAAAVARHPAPARRSCHVRQRADGNGQGLTGAELRQLNDWLVSQPNYVRSPAAAMVLIIGGAGAADR
jgi:hypothetical protein